MSGQALFALGELGGEGRGKALAAAWAGWRCLGGLALLRAGRVLSRHRHLLVVDTELGSGRGPTPAGFLAKEFDAKKME